MRKGALAAGTKVVLSQQGLKQWCPLSVLLGKELNENNPPNMMGTVIEPEAYWAEENSPFVNRVVWANGYVNSYFAGDLDLVQ